MKVYIGGYPRHLCISWEQEYGNLGSLFSPGQRLSSKIRYCLDNGAFSCFNPRAFLHHIERGCAIGLPDFIVCPDAVQDSQETLRRWWEWEPCLREFERPIAFCIQDGQDPTLIPPTADLLFLGGSTQYKLLTLKFWVSRFPTHVGRVNTWARLWMCAIAGAVSCDGTGWFRKSSDHWSARDLLLFLKVQKGEVPPIDHPSWPFISLEARKSLLECPSWNLKKEALFREVT